MVGITQKSFETLFPLQFLNKTMAGYTDLEQKETYETLKNIGWYSKCIVGTPPLLLKGGGVGPSKNWGGVWKGG